MTGVTGLLIKLGARFVVFGLVFFLAARRSPKIELRSKWFVPLIALVFAVLNMGAYWLVRGVIGLATFGAIGILLPLAVNLVLLLVTARVFAVTQKPWLAIKGALPDRKSVV